MTRSVLRPAVMALAAAAALGLAGRVAIHAGYVLPHGDMLAAGGRAFVALGAPWLAVAWGIGALSGRRRARSRWPRRRSRGTRSAWPRAASRRSTTPGRSRPRGPSWR